MKERYSAAALIDSYPTFFCLQVEPCEPIEKVLWRVDRSNYVDYFVFSGGLSIDVTGVPPSITFMRGM
jgi:hypothetical protein